MDGGVEKLVAIVLGLFRAQADIVKEGEPECGSSATRGLKLNKLILKWINDNIVN